MEGDLQTSVRRRTWDMVKFSLLAWIRQEPKTLPHCTIGACFCKFAISWKTSFRSGNQYVTSGSLLQIPVLSLLCSSFNQVLFFLSFSGRARRSASSKPGEFGTYGISGLWRIVSSEDSNADVEILFFNSPRSLPQPSRLPIHHSPSSCCPSHFSDFHTSKNPSWANFDITGFLTLCSWIYWSFHITLYSPLLDSQTNHTQEIENWRGNFPPSPLWISPDASFIPWQRLQLQKMLRFTTTTNTHEKQDRNLGRDRAARHQQLELRRPDT